MSSVNDDIITELDTEIKTSMVVNDRERKRKVAFKFANRIGRQKSTFYNLWTKGNRVHRATAEKIAQATGTDPD